MSSNMEFMSIQKFTGKNYTQWRFQIKCALNAKGLFEYADGQKVAPTETTEFAKWKKDDAMALFIISSSLDHNQVRLIENCANSKDAMEKLDNFYKQKSKFSKMTLLDNFHQLRMEKSDSMIQYISKVENLAQEIKDSGETISDDQVVIKIVGSLSPQYRNFRQAWLSMSEDQQTLKNLTSRLLDEESLNTSGEKFVEGALIAETRQKVTKDFECFFCKKKGHIKRNCNKYKEWLKKKSQESQSDVDSNNSKRKEHCMCCENSKENFGNKLIQSPNKYVFNATTKYESEVNKWVLDSGASYHMTYRRDFLFDYEELYNESIYLADDTELKIHGQGKVYLKSLINGRIVESVMHNVKYIPMLKRNLISEGVVLEKGLQITKTSRNVKVCKNKEIVLQAAMNENNICFVKCDTEVCKINSVGCAYTKKKKSKVNNAKILNFHNDADNNEKKSKKDKSCENSAKKCEHNLKDKVPINDCYSKFAYIYFGESTGHEEELDKVQADESRKLELQQEDKFEKDEFMQSFSGQDSDLKEQTDNELDESALKSEQNKDDQIDECKQDVFHDTKDLKIKNKDENSSRQKNIRTRKQTEHFGENVYEKKICKMKDKQGQ